MNYWHFDWHLLSGKRSYQTILLSQIGQMSIKVQNHWIYHPYNVTLRNEYVTGIAD